MIRSVVTTVSILVLSLFCAAAATAQEEYEEEYEAEADAETKSDNDGRFYVEARGGISAPQTLNLNDIDISGAPASLQGLGTLNYFVGGTVVLAGGYQINDYFRTELEASYRKANFDKIDYRDKPNEDVYGDARSFTSMVNFYHDMRAESDQRIVPYIGVGFGFAYVKLDPQIPGSPSLDHDEFDFAWNAGFGIYCGIADGFGISVGYRYMGTTKLEFENSAGNDVEMNYGTHDTTIGVRYTF